MIMRAQKTPDEEEKFARGTDQYLSAPTNDYKMGDRIIRPVVVKDAFPVVVKKAPSGTGGKKTVHMSVGYKSLRGRSAVPPHKPNQDSLSIFQVESRPDVAIFSVFDGHGPFGEYASHFCRNEFHPALAAAPSFKYDIKAGLSEALQSVHDQFIKVSPSTGVDPLVSGTTAITVAVEGDHIYCANVGDSRALLGSKSASGVTTVVELSEDHNPRRADEKARIKKSSAILMTERDVRGLSGSTPSDKIYVCREKNGDIVYGVLFTRSLGDKDAHEHLGVSEVAEHRNQDIKEDDKYLILASDGIWDHMTNEEVVDVCFDKDDPHIACEAITRTAAERWETQDPDHRRDDITVLIVKLWEKPSKRKASSRSADDVKVEA